MDTRRNGIAVPSSPQEGTCGVEDGVRMLELRTLIRYAGGDLNPTQRFAVVAYASGISDNQAARELDGLVSPQALWQARKIAFEKMRKRLGYLRVRRAGDVL